MSEAAEIVTEHVRMPIRKAAKIVNRDYRKLRILAKSGAIRSYRKGGNSHSPWLEVYLDQLRHDLDRVEQFKRASHPPERKSRRLSSSSTLHPAALAM